MTSRLCLCTREGSLKQWVEPESISADIIGAELEIAEDVKEMWSKLGLERADALSRTTSHKEGQRSPRHVRRPEDCLAFF